MNIRRVFRWILMTTLIFTSVSVTAETVAAKSWSDQSSMLLAKGSRYFAADEHAKAIGAFQQALGHIRRTDGVHSLRQLEVIDWLTIVYIQQRDMTSANAQQRLYHYLNVVHYGEGSAETLFAMMKLADWYRASGQLDQALFAYEDALDVIEENALADYQRQEPLRGIDNVLEMMMTRDS